MAADRNRGRETFKPKNYQRAMLGIYTELGSRTSEPSPRVTDIPTCILCIQSQTAQLAGINGSAQFMQKHPSRIHISFRTSKYKWTPIICLNFFPPNLIQSCLSQSAAAVICLVAFTLMFRIPRLNHSKPFDPTAAETLHSDCPISDLYNLELQCNSD